MNSSYSIFLAFVISSLALSSVSAAEEKETEIYNVSPKGSYHIQWVEDEHNWFVVSTKNSAERAVLPESSTESDPTECQVEFFYSPDENWLFYTEKWRRCDLRGRQLYQHETGLKFAPLKAKRPFTKMLQNYVVEKGVFKRSDFVDAHEQDYDHLGTQFRGWSFDSNRFLIGIYCEVSERGPAYVYFNTRTKTLEQTPYLRQVNKNVAKAKEDYGEDAVCAEPTSPLPSESESKARLDILNNKLAESVAGHMRALKDDAVNEFRKEQEKWVKSRDDGVKTYLAFARKGQEERARLQFLADVTAARIDEINQSPTTLLGP